MFSYPKILFLVSLLFVALLNSIPTYFLNFEFFIILVCLLFIHAKAFITIFINPNTTTLRSCHPVIFDCLDGDLIHRTAVRIEGSAGPSGVDALGWRRLCNSFRTASSDLCHSLASVARRISTSFIDLDALQSLLNCRLIALDKNLAVRSIGIGETSRRIIAKAVLYVVKQDVMDAAGAVCRTMC